MADRDKLIGITCPLHVLYAGGRFISKGHIMSELATEVSVFFYRLFRCRHRNPDGRYQCERWLHLGEDHR